MGSFSQIPMRHTPSFLLTRNLAGKLCSGGCILAVRSAQGRPVLRFDRSRREEIKGGRDSLRTGSVAAAGTATGPARQTEFSRHQGQVGHRGCQVKLEFCLGASEIAGLADAQMDQSGQPVFHHHSARSIFVIPGALLQRSGFLQEGFLGMDQHPPSLSPLGRDVLGAQWTCPTYRPRRTGRPAGGGPNPRHQSAFPPARWYG